MKGLTSSAPSTRVSRLVVFLLALVMLTVVLPLKPQQSASASSVLPTQWWEKLSGGARYYPKYEGKTLSQIQGELDGLYASGYRIVEILGPYKSANPAAAYKNFAGLAPLDYFSVDPTIGTSQDWTNLINAAHQKGMAVIVFLNLGYDSSDSASLQHDLGNQ